jgi:hypothetical protein
MPGMAIIAVVITLIVAFYTVLYGLEVFKEKNSGGAVAIMFLALIIVALPVYMLYFAN